jgi:hypothetical protein
MKKIFKKLWKLTKLGLMLLGVLVVIHVAILVIHNATSKPTPPPGGWYPPQPGDENYVEPKK